MALVTLEQLKTQLEMDHDESDSFIEELCERASMIVLGYLKLEADAYQEGSPLEPADVPKHIEAAVLLAGAALFENRDGSPDGPQPLSQTVKDLLHRDRDPAMA